MHQPGGVRWRQSRSRAPRQLRRRHYRSVSGRQDRRQGGPSRPVAPTCCCPAGMPRRRTRPCRARPVWTEETVRPDSEGIILTAKHAYVTRTHRFAVLGGGSVSTEHPDAGTGQARKRNHNQQRVPERHRKVHQKPQDRRPAKQSNGLTAAPTAAATAIAPPRYGRRATHQSSLGSPRPYSSRSYSPPRAPTAPVLRTCAFLVRGIRRTWLRDLRSCSMRRPVPRFRYVEDLAHGRCSL